MSDGPPPVAQTMLAEVCDGHLVVWLARTARWLDDPEALGELVQRNASRPFTAATADGKFAGVYSPIGPSAAGSVELTGGYAGAPPCAPEDRRCQAFLGGCNLAVADLGTQGVDEGPDLATGKACVKGTQLLVDIDADATPEAFPLAALAGLADATDSRTPADPAGCSWRFSQPLGGDSALLGVLDLDGDGRRELVVARGKPGARGQAAVFSAAGAPGHLVRAAARELR